MNYKISVYADGEKEKAGKEDIATYYELRKRVYAGKWGKEQDEFYGNYPTEHDKRNSTIFLIFSVHPENGKIIFGGRRIAFPEDGKIGTLPLEGKHRITDRKGADRFISLREKAALNIDDIIPALRHDANIRYAELGAFAIDQHLTRQFFNRDEYIRMREDAYQKSLEAARDAGVDVVIIGAGRVNLEHQLQWLERQKQFQYKRLGSSRDLFSNPLPKGDESELLIINISNRYSLRGAEGILRHNQTAASAARNSR